MLMSLNVELEFVGEEMVNVNVWVELIVLRLRVKFVKSVEVSVNDVSVMLVWSSLFINKEFVCLGFGVFLLVWFCGFL